VDLCNAEDDKKAREKGAEGCILVSVGGTIVRGEYVEVAKRAVF
jgi:hypothetical protein